MHVVAELMTTEVKFLYNDANLLDAHNLTKDTGIRHIPILNKADNTYLGVVSQKAMLARIMAIATEFGTNRLERRESEITITDIMDTNNETVGAQTTLSIAAQHFLNKKYGCLPVVSDDKVLLGILSSSDFVRLAIELLEKE